MKRYEKLCENPLELAEYITKKLDEVYDTSKFTLSSDLRDKENISTEKVASTIILYFYKNAKKFCSFGNNFYL